MRLVEPWPDGYTINKRSPYGPRVHPITKRKTFHHGVDVALPVGTPLTAPADGVVVHKNRTASAGFNLILRHEGTWHTVYYHLQKASHLPLNSKVKTGDLIAHSGNTGASTGPHLHWELRKSRKWGDTVDPVPYLVSEPSKPEPEPVQVEPVKVPDPPRWEHSTALQRGFKLLRQGLR
jgi:murein DD-endopeptidase MepM/ murein hydrolase activator NlpD